MRGAAESAAWAAHRGLDLSRSPHWYVEIRIPCDDASAKLEVNIYPEEWGVVFQRGRRVSSIRVTDVPFVHGLDDFGLLPSLPPLAELDRLLRDLEARLELSFERARATLHSNLVEASRVVRPWLVAPGAN